MRGKSQLFEKEILFVIVPLFDELQKLDRTFVAEDIMVMVKYFLPVYEERENYNRW